MDRAMAQSGGLPVGRGRTAVGLLSVALLALCSTTGCTFWGFSGSGPVEKDTAYRLHGRAPWKLPDFQKQSYQGLFQSTPWAAVPQEAFAFSGDRATFRQTSRRNWDAIAIIGYSPAENLIALDRDGKTESLIGRSGVVLPLFPVPILWWHMWDTWYAVDRGEELATRTYYGLGPAGLILGYTRCVQPSDIPTASGNLCLTGPGTFGQYLAANIATKGDECKYNSQWGWTIGAGLIGWGRVNFDYFAQVAWIPIPLWRIRE